MLLEIASLDERLGHTGTRVAALDDGFAAAHLARLAEKALERDPEQRPPGRAALETPHCVHRPERYATSWRAQHEFVRTPTVPGVGLEPTRPEGQLLLRQ
jgi:hypothetical protein